MKTETHKIIILLFSFAILGCSSLKKRNYIKYAREMRNTIIIFFSMLLFCSVELKSQNKIEVDTLSYRYYNSITQQEEIIDSYQIANNSTEDYLTWVSLEPINNRTNIKLIHDFFKKRKGDFSLIEMMYENLLDELPINVGYSFIKKISAGETFSYFIAKTETNSNLYRERIVTIKKKEVECYLKTTIDEKYFLKLPSIFLME